MLYGKSWFMTAEMLLDCSHGGRKRHHAGLDPRKCPRSWRRYALCGALGRPVVRPGMAGGIGRGADTKKPPCGGSCRLSYHRWSVVNYSALKGQASSFTGDRASRSLAASLATNVPSTSCSRSPSGQYP